nr:unnamed protein product [uncultured bacterium]
MDSLGQWLGQVADSEEEGECPFPRIRVNRHPYGVLSALQEILERVGGATRQDFLAEVFAVAPGVVQ